MVAGVSMQCLTASKLSTRPAPAPAPPEAPVRSRRWPPAPLHSPGRRGPDHQSHALLHSEGRNWMWGLVVQVGRIVRL